MLSSALRRGLITGAVSAAALAIPAMASAATLSVDKPCYIDLGVSAAEPMVVTGTGFSPGDSIDITDTGGGGFYTQATADGSGNFSTTVAAPTFYFANPGTKSDSLSATDITPTGDTITANSSAFLVAPLAVATHPSSARLTKKVTWSFSGFDPGRTIYGHYLHGRHNHPVARAKFGRAQGPCGTLTVRARFYPGGHPRYSKYTLQVDNSKRYVGKRAIPRVLLRIYKTLLPF